MYATPLPDGYAIHEDDFPSDFGLLEDSDEDILIEASPLVGRLAVSLTHQSSRAPDAAPTQPSASDLPTSAVDPRPSNTTAN